MPKYQVFSGKLSVTILADDPHAAAVESLQWWGGDVESYGNDGAMAHSRHLEEQVFVRQVGSRRPAERFITFHLLASLNRETPNKAWRRLLSHFNPNHN
jgi:hypothetical protein